MSQESHQTPVAIVEGIGPGVIGRVTEMHGRHYAAAAGFDHGFEALVARELAGFCADPPPRSAIWTARSGGAILGSVAIDGHRWPGPAHLRWFIVDPALRGQGAGRRLLRAAVDFCDAAGFSGIELWTFAGLDAARHLYEAEGFACVEKRPGDRWGREVMEQRFLRPAPQPAP
ncbi:GNAT family N-acetyltransferase [Frigidibacter oleivorans]|uniref:GNAT family N-acetyltransferase n=1 Tax=Frigidibacter oleivorans TaxID=2487129 RepID=UPI000F8C59D4|nr:GNAT family N-acetyltransferase [Frigidibacter oleivorans]